MNRLLLITLLAAACTDSQSEQEHINEVFENANADRVTCTNWTGVSDCANACDPKPTATEPPPGSPMCYSQFIVVLDGVPGYCSVRFAPDRVDWTPCGVQ